MATLFGKLREHELELGRLKDEEEIEEKKSIVLKATNKNITETEMDDKELMTLMVRKFSRLMQNDSQLSNHAGESKRKSFSTNVVQCYECGKECHIKPDCPELQPKQKGKKRFPQGRNMRRKGAYIAWENSDSENSSDEDSDQEEESNLCYMTGVTWDDYDSDADISNEPVDVKYELLQDAFKQLHPEAMRLQYKVNRLSSERRDFENRIKDLVAENEKLEKEFNEALSSTRDIEIKTVTIEKACENCPTHIKKIYYLTSTLAKFTQGKRKSIAMNKQADTKEVVYDDEPKVEIHMGYPKEVTPQRYLNLRLFEKENFKFPGWIEKQSLSTFLQLNGEWFPDLVRTFYQNLRIVDGNICSKDKGVDITISNDIWLQTTGLKPNGILSHKPESQINFWFDKKDMFRSLLRVPISEARDNMLLHKDLKMKEMLLAHILAQVILPGRLNNIPTNWLEVFKDHMIEATQFFVRQFPYGVLVSNMLILHGVHISSERKYSNTCSDIINFNTLASLGIVWSNKGWHYDEDVDITNVIRRTSPTKQLRSNSMSDCPHGTYFIDLLQLINDKLKSLESKINFILRNLKNTNQDENISMKFSKKTVVIFLERDSKGGVFRTYCLINICTNKAWRHVKTVAAWQPVKRAMIGLASFEECWLHCEDCSTWVQIVEEGILAAILLWEIEDLERKDDYHNVCLNYCGYVTQRLVNFAPLLSVVEAEVFNYKPTYLNGKRRKTTQNLHQDDLDMLAHTHKPHSSKTPPRTTLQPLNNNSARSTHVTTSGSPPLNDNRVEPTFAMDELRWRLASAGEMLVNEGENAGEGKPKFGSRRKKKKLGEGKPKFWSLLLEHLTEGHISFVLPSLRSRHLIAEDRGLKNGRSEERTVKAIGDFASEGSRITPSRLVLSVLEIPTETFWRPSWGRKRRLPMVTTRSMDGIDHTELLTRLQAQLEQQTQMILQQQEAHQQLVAEIAQLRERQQEVTEDNSHTGNPNHGRRNGRNNHHHDDSGPPPRSPELLPFTEEIMQTEMPDRPPPQIKKFDGTTDPEHHLRNFIDSMAFYSNSDPVKCRAFSLSLKDEALEWYYTLPPNSVDNFQTVTTLFKRQFSASRRERVSAAELVNLKQGRDEPLRTFMRRYSETARRVKGVSHEFIISNLPNCLKPGFISESLYAELPKTMEELHERMTKFIKMEDQRHYRKKIEVPATDAKRDDKRADDRGRNQRPLRRELKAPLGPRYDHYTHLTAPRDKVFDKAFQANLITIHKRRTPRDADASKICRFHDNQGHSTEGCQGLKDEIERLVRAGYLREFVKTETCQRGRSPQRERSPRKFRRSPEPPRRKPEHPRERSRSRSRKRDPTPKGRIDTISGGFAGGASSSARKRHLRNLRSVHTIALNPLSMPDITFTNRDFHAPDPEQDDPMSSRPGLRNMTSVNILYWTTFQRMALTEGAITPFHEQIVGFAGQRVDTGGYIDLKTRLGTGDQSREIRVRFLLVEANASYNALLGRPCLNAFGAIVSTPHLAMKFPSGKGEICTVRADQKTARQCYTASLKAATYKRESRPETILVDLDPRTNTDDRIQPQGEIKSIVLGKNKEQVTNIGADLTPANEGDLTALLRTNNNLFAWSASDMPGIHPEKKRRLGTEKRAAVQKEVDKLIAARFIREITYTTWLANVVMVKKSNGQWRMCVDFTDLNKACPKDNYPLPSIDRLVDGASGHTVLSFLDAYSGYNQIPMYAPDRSHTTFITEQANYCYEVMPFGLKNAGATYQ
ncbi:hypothetical protein V8G54_034759 [Vigna mungo]|uniref:CCHC-type domain-containing protein n=1 Tax=Vigna mungo TaxID=3915 RepID=A0AAQ3REY9_VIGMU